jgi:hypothetical protein
VSEPRYPPVTALAMTSLALIVIGGIYLSAHLPQHVPLGPAVGLLCASALILLINMVLLSRVREFDWARFFEVGKWSLLGYMVIGGMIEYVFLRNHLQGGALVVLTISVLIFTIHVPMLVGFTVARYHRPAELEADVPAP